MNATVKDIYKLFDCPVTILYDNNNFELTTPVLAEFWYSKVSKIIVGDRKVMLEVFNK